MMNHYLNNIKKTIIVLLLLFVSFSFVFAIPERDLEVWYPEISGIQPQTIEGTGLGSYVRYIFFFIIIVSGMVTFASLVYAGYLWMSSGGNPSKLGVAKDRIISSFVGIIIILSSFLILNTIDPKLVRIEAPGLRPALSFILPGVYLSDLDVFPVETEEFAENIFFSSSSIIDLSFLMMDKKPKSLRIINNFEITSITGEELYPEDFWSWEEEFEIKKLGDFIYAAILHEKKNMEGKCELFTNITTDPKDYEFQHNASSMTILTQSSQIPSEKGVFVYDKADHPESGATKVTLPDMGMSVYFAYPLTPLPSSIEEDIWSIKIDGDYALLLADGADWSSMNKCSIFTRSVSDLKGHEINKCRPWWKWLWGSYDSCATHYAVFSIQKR